MITAGTGAGVNAQDTDSKSRCIAETTSSLPIKALSPDSKENGPERKVPLPHANTFPSTPSDKLTLDELIGNVDESRFKKPTEESPEEILGWNPNSSNPATTPGRKRKRAQSSSPGWPSAASQTAEQGLGISTLHKTPITDPAAELWQRYGGRDQNGGKLPDVSFALQATPRPLETPLKTAGLRRWASAGNEWPSNRSKRQRTNPTKVWQDGQRPTNGQSKVAAMIEKIQEIQENLASQQLSKQHSRKDDPSSSSPLPDVGATFSPARSPLNLRKPAPPQPQRAIIMAPSRPSQVSGAINGAARLSQKGPQQSGRSPQGTRPSSRHGQGHIAKRDSSGLDEAAVVPPKITIAADDLDEFAMDAFDDFDENEIVSKSQLAPISLATPKPAKESRPESIPMQIDAADLAAFDADFDDINVDDEFGLDDEDEEGFLEAELCATQAHNQRASSASQHSSMRYT